VGLREPVLAEPADLLEHALGEVGRDPLRDHARDEAVAVVVDAAGLAPRGHVAAELVRLAGRVVGGDDGELHHLLLEERHAERLPEHRLERGVRVERLLLAGAAAQVRVHHPARDRPGPHDRHLDDEVVERRGTQARQHRHLRAALDLEDAERVGAPDHRVGRLVLRGQRRERQVGAARLPHEVEAPVQVRQRAETEQVDLEEAQRLDVVLVPLDDGAPLHRRVLDGHEVVHGSLAEQEAARVDREVPRHPLDLVREPQQVAVERRPRVEARVGERRFAGDVSVVRQELRDAVERRLRDAERAADVAHRGAAAVADDVGDHRRAVASVLRVDVLDHLLAARVLDVEVDVGRLRALDREEALEEQVDPHGVDGRDPQAPAHGRVRRRAASLAEDPALRAEADDLVHRQEVARVAELLDDGELLPDLLAHGGGDAAGVAARGALLDETQQARGRGRAVGQRLGRVAVGELPHRELAALGDLARAAHGGGVVGEETLEGEGREQRVAVVLLREASRGRERHAVADARHHVLQIAPRRRVVEHLVRGGDGQREARRGRAQPLLGADLLGRAVAREQREERVTERVREQRQRLLARPVPQGEEARGVRTDLVPRHLAPPLRAAQAALGDEAAEVRVARAAGGEQHDRRAARDGHLRADDETQPRLARRDVRAHDARHAVAVGERERLEPEPPRLGDELVRPARALEERVRALHPERAVRRKTLHHGGTEARRRLRITEPVECPPVAMRRP
jgi:hypothetical protein